MENELVQLDSVYRSPGFLLLATDDQGERLGCVGVRDLGGDDAGRTGEVRRLFVRDQGRGQGLGRELAVRLRADASAAGMTRLVLNTLPEMHEAISLYESMGFARIDPYVDEPIDQVLYFGLDL